MVGSIGEVGGQVLYMSVVMAYLLDKGLVMYNIRSGRSSSGLRSPYLAGINDGWNMAKGKVEGNKVIDRFEGKI